MLGDIIVRCKIAWKQFICIHNYIPKYPLNEFGYFTCTKCGKITKNYNLIKR